MDLRPRLAVIQDLPDNPLPADSKVMWITTHVNLRAKEHRSIILPRSRVHFFMVQGYEAGETMEIMY